MLKEELIELLDSWYHHDEHTEEIAEEIIAFFKEQIKKEFSTWHNYLQDNLKTKI